MTARILLDTDVGGDFDDANPLVLRVRLDDVEVVGVTTGGAGGDASKRARVASHILRRAGRADVPVHPRIDWPLVRNPALEALAPEMILNACDESMAGAELSPVHAVDALLAAAAAHAGELTPVCIGTLTNVAGGSARTRTFFVDWDKTADDAVAVLRAEAGGKPHDQDLTNLHRGTPIRARA